MKKRILIVDDNRDFIVILRSMLKGIGDFKIFVAHDGIDGEVQCEVHKPDLVFMDLCMPVMDGIVASRIIHRLFPELPIIMVSAADISTNKNAAIEAGCKTFLKKPIFQDQLQKVVCEFMPPLQQATISAL